MTYAWAILITTAIVSILFVAGAFNPLAYAARVQPGSCYVYRPNGPGTTSYINLEGTCSGELPEYVLNTEYSTMTVNSVAYTPELTNNGLTSVTITAWAMTTDSVEDSNVYTYAINPGCCGSSYPGISAEEFLPGPGNTAAWAIGSLTLSGSNNINDQDLPYFNLFGLPPFVRTYKFTFYAISYNGNTMTHYFVASNGVIQSVTFNAPLGNLVLPADSPLYIGSSYFGVSKWQGYISNIQVYNTTLSENEINSLYLEGIGGAPIQLQNLAGWWPLNGNGDDYSGNGANNTSEAPPSAFQNNWLSTYAPP